MASSIIASLSTLDSNGVFINRYLLSLFVFFGVLALAFRFLIYCFSFVRWLFKIIVRKIRRKS